MSESTSEINGIIIKGIGGFYYVAANDEIYTCSARGLFRLKEITPMVGDKVSVSTNENEEFVITEILPRRNEFTRPKISNVDCFVVVISVRIPKVSLHILDKFLVMAEYHNTDIIICINKIDLAEKEELEEIERIYSPIYDTVKVSAKTGEGIETLRDVLDEGKIALAGPSGVGKSSIINHLLGQERAIVGEIGRKTERGRHTTRHIELYKNDGYYLFDTPGFTSFELAEPEIDDLRELFPEMEKLSGQCMYSNCRHLEEPGCAVIEAKEKNKIENSRYESYCQMIKEINEKRTNG